MIQRVQTIYLILATLAGAMTFFLPFAHFYANDSKVTEYVMFGVFNVQSEVMEMTSPFGFPAWVLGALSVLIPLISIFLYKNRPLQMRIVRLAFLVNLGYIVYLFLAIDAINARLYEDGLDILHHSGF